MARTTKTRTKSSTNNGGDLPKRVKNLEIENASIKAEKVSWRWWVTAHAASIVFMLSVMGAGFLFLDAKIEAVETNLMAEIDEVKEDVAEVKENQARMDERQIRMQEDINNLADGVRMLLELGIAQQSGDPAAIDAAEGAIIEKLGKTPSDASSLKTPITGIELGEGLVVAPSDSLGETHIYTANTPTLTLTPQEI